MKCNISNLLKFTLTNLARWVSRLIRFVPPPFWISLLYGHRNAPWSMAHFFNSFFFRLWHSWATLNFFFPAMALMGHTQFFFFFSAMALMGHTQFFFFRLWHSWATLNFFFPAMALMGHTFFFFSAMALMVYTHFFFFF